MFYYTSGYCSSFYANQDVLDWIILKYIPKKKFVICYAGTINSNNPIDVLIEAGVLLKDEAIAF
jgi:hypothetical protein